MAHIVCCVVQSARLHVTRDRNNRDTQYRSKSKRYDFRRGNGGFCRLCRHFILFAVTPDRRVFSECLAGLLARGSWRFAGPSPQHSLQVACPVSTLRIQSRGRLRLLTPCMGPPYPNSLFVSQHFVPNGKPNRFYYGAFFLIAKAQIRHVIDAFAMTFNAWELAHCRCRSSISSRSTGDGE